MNVSEKCDTEEKKFRKAKKDSAQIIGEEY